MSKEKFNNIILFGGKTKNENMPMGFYSSLAMLLLRGKPLIWWQLQNLSKQGVEDYILVVSKENNELLQYIKNVYYE
jgi:NDP-sugar pyrophosphorylase family protein